MEVHIWNFNKADYAAGREAGERGDPPVSPDGRDFRSWARGYIDGLPTHFEKSADLRN